MLNIQHYLGLEPIKVLSTPQNQTLASQVTCEHVSGLSVPSKRAKLDQGERSVGTSGHPVNADDPNQPSYSQAGADVGSLIVPGNLPSNYVLGVREKSRYSSPSTLREMRTGEYRQKARMAAQLHDDATTASHNYIRTKSTAVAKRFIPAVIGSAILKAALASAPTVLLLPLESLLCNEECVLGSEPFPKVELDHGGKRGLRASFPNFRILFPAEILYIYITSTGDQRFLVRSFDCLDGVASKIGPENILN